MRIGEEHAALCKSIEVWRSRLRMTSKTTNPIIQVIDRNEQYIRPRYLIRAQQAGQGDCNQTDQ